MTKNKILIIEEDEECEEKIVKTPPWKLIRRKFYSKRAAVNEYQASLFSKIFRRLERDVLREFQISNPEQINLDRFEDFFKLESYDLLIDAFLGCGFSCGDMNNSCDLDEVYARPDEMIRSMDFPALRLFLHTLQRAEKWADCYSSPLLNAIKNGVLAKAVARLESDDSLYERL